MQYNQFLKKGFSLMEIMVVLVIIAIIGGTAYPYYQKLVIKSKQTEAKTMLRSIYMSQELYNITNQKFATKITDLDITIPTTTRYSYQIKSVDNGETFTATATANLDNDPVEDRWDIDQTNTLKNTVNDAIE
ncbi:MAG: prepilin-type N-terminal cleavage/methylation domain-containing protein [bacterium]|jgi:prepilin-type N-terminal cleavage/methylation domain-containing protein